MQIVAEKAPHVIVASLFFAVDDRKDGSKTFTTIAYQLAAKCKPYCDFIRNEVARDPALLRRALPAQFNKFIVEPFIRHLVNYPHRFVILIDGLDECSNPLTQRELLELISNFCIQYPTSPVVWIVASRPEPIITLFFDKPEVAPAYTKEDVAVDSEEGRQDVDLYLGDELEKVKLAYPTLQYEAEWPSKLDLLKITTASGGLFAYASIVVKYIDDPHYQDPASQLLDVLMA
ncbi:hypothetical protein AGABI2DRAFT_207859, partial [Agaricus bisporus var. bisporus H97]|uniref:hypothetical protein n=1 Tax=Agaricus bisporus var. bisporus (strain H97 / ATCC MYA-4626 / FGSC 10389) TaxID=936046 RepID=UPI00029F6D5F